MRAISSAVKGPILGLQLGVLGIRFRVPSLGSRVSWCTWNFLDEVREDLDS